VSVLIERGEKGVAGKIWISQPKNLLEREVMPKE
jgi:hypothetical protein